MKLLRELNTGKITIQANNTEESVSNELKDYLIHVFHKELIHGLITNKLNRNDIQIFKANQLQIIFNKRRGAIYIIFFRNDEESKIEIVTNSQYFDNVLTSLMIEIEQNDGDTLFGFETDFGKIYNRAEISEIINECLMIQNE
jgi:hypothetical protein